MKIKNKQTRPFLMWLVMLVTAFSLCSVGDVGLTHAKGHTENPSAPVSRCMLSTCDTLISKNVSSPEAEPDFAPSLGLSFIPLLLLNYRTGLTLPAALLALQDPRLENPPQLYQLYSVLII